MSRISVFLADWQVLFREGVHFTLSGEEDIDVIGEATSSEEALKAIQAHPPRVAVMNAEHEDFAGIQVTRYLRQNSPSVAVLLMIDSKDDEHLFLAMKSGASACLTKEVDPGDLIDTIRLIAQGKQPVAEAMLMPSSRPMMWNGRDSAAYSPEESTFTLFFINWRVKSVRIRKVM